MREFGLQDRTDRTSVVVYYVCLIVSYCLGYYVLTFHIFRQSVNMYVYLVKANLETIRVFRDSYITGGVCVCV